MHTYVVCMLHVMLSHFLYTMPCDTPHSPLTQHLCWVICWRLQWLCTPTDIIHGEGGRAVHATIHVVMHNIIWCILCMQACTTVCDIHCMRLVCMQLYITYDYTLHTTVCYIRHYIWHYITYILLCICILYVHCT